MPAAAAAALIPGLIVPDRYESICNLHYRYRLPPGPAGFWGLVNGTAEWVFAKGEVLSVTISAANRHAATPNEALAATVWTELVRAFQLAAAMPPYRVVREKRATFAATPAQLARRPATRTANPNWVLAGDYTATGLPATLEGAVRSGHRAALALLTRT